MLYVFFFMVEWCVCRYDRILVDEVVSKGDVLLIECIIWVVLIVEEFINGEVNGVFDYVFVMEEEWYELFCNVVFLIVYIGMWKCFLCIWFGVCICKIVYCISVGE